MRLALILATLVVAGSVGAGGADARPRGRTAASANRSLPRPERVAQQPTPLDVAIATAQRAEKARADLVARRAELARRYQDEVAEIDRLKRQQASWRRDRALRARLASSLETARALTELADRIKRAGAELARARAAAVIAIDRALPTAGPRRAELERRRRAWAPAPPPPRRIVIPDEALDPLADPEELALQAAALRDSEAELAREIDRLAQQAERFDRIAAVRKQHDRAEELDRRDDGDPRRVASRGGAEAAQDGVASPLPPTEDSGPSSDPAAGFGDGRELSTALAEVVDPATVDALRKAERSTDPATRAAAARRAREAVVQRLARLRKQRGVIEGRARELRAGE